MRLRGRSTETITACIWGFLALVGILAAILNRSSPGLVVFGIAFALVTAVLAVRAARAGLYLDDDGLTARMDVSTRRWRWAEIADAEYRRTSLAGGIYVTPVDGKRRKVLHLNVLWERERGMEIQQALRERLQ
jgi:hypothetical protein